MTIGYDSAAGLGGYYGLVSDSHMLIDHPSYTIVAVPGEAIRELGAYFRDSSTGQIEVGVYDITAGTAGAALVVSTVVNAPGGVGTTNVRVSVPITEVPLTAGNTYAVAQRAIADALIPRGNQNAGPHMSGSVLTGTSALAASWTDNSNSDSLLGLFAKTTEDIFIDFVPSAVARGESGIVITGAGLSDVAALGGATLNGEAVVVTASTATTATLTIPSDIDLLYGDYALTVFDGEGTATSSNISFTPAAGRSYIRLSNPFYTSNAYMLFGYTGTPAPVTGDQLEYDTTTIPSGIANTPGTDSEWVLASMPSSNQTTTCNIIRAATGVRSAPWAIEWVIAGAGNFTIVTQTVNNSLRRGVF